VLLAIVAIATGVCSRNDKAERSVSAAPGTAKAKPGPSPRSSPPAPNRSLLFIGTSLTAGLGLDPDSAYPALIQRKIDSAGLAFTVVNAGVSGETTSGLLDRLDWLLRGDFAVVVLETGANDGLRGIPAAVVRKNIGTVLARIKAARPDARVLVVQMEVLPNLGPRYATEFHAVYPQLAKASGVTLVPFLLTGVAGRTDLNQADGIHPNQKGEHIVADNVWRAIEVVLREVEATGH